LITSLGPASPPQGSEQKNSTKGVIPLALRLGRCLSFELEGWMMESEYEGNVISGLVLPCFLTLWEKEENKETREREGEP
jgi:hypothetical protein